MRHTFAMVFARLGRDERRVLCGVTECGEQLGEVVEAGDGRRYLMLGMGYRERAAGEWSGPSRLRGRRPDGLHRRVANTIDGPRTVGTNTLPRALPVKIWCRACGAGNAALADRLEVEPTCDNSTWSQVRAWSLASQNHSVKYTLRLPNLPTNAVSDQLGQGSVSGTTVSATPHPFVLFARAVAEAAQSSAGCDTV